MDRENNSKKALLKLSRKPHLYNLPLFSGPQMYCMLTHLVYYGKYPTDHYPFPAAGASGIVHAMHASFDSLVVKNNFSLLIIFLLLKVALVFNMLMNAACLFSPLLIFDISWPSLVTIITQLQRKVLERHDTSRVLACACVF